MRGSGYFAQRPVSVAAGRRPDASEASVLKIRSGPTTAATVAAEAGSDREPADTIDRMIRNAYDT